MPLLETLGGVSWATKPLANCKWTQVSGFGAF